ncbi:MAG: glycosyltransferase family 2 protein [Burkholderiales bacterium]|nr:glycosyltransferase family 2 protein [Burkholderiales bacterium]
MMRNEGDIAEAFVRHHLSLFDHLLILDHASTDSTTDILRALVAEGLPLTVHRDESLAFQQGPRTTVLAREAFRTLRADYVLPVDADEMLRTSSRQALETSLASIPAGQCGQIAWQNYVVTEEDDFAELNPVARITHRPAIEPNPTRNVVLTPYMMGDERWEVAPGNHWLAMQTHRGMFAAKMQPLPDLSYAHFAIRSEAQLHQKVFLGWLSARLQNPAAIQEAGASNVSGAYSWHWRHLFADMLDQPHVPVKRLQDYALRLYVHKSLDVDSAQISPLIKDPVPAPYTLRYTSPSAGSALVSLARWTDDLLTRVGQSMSPS